MIKGVLTVAFVHICTFTACADPVIFVKGGPGPTSRKQHVQRSSTYFTVYRRGSNVFITEKTILFQGSKGGPLFSRGVQLLSGGSPNTYFCRTPCNLSGCEFPVEGGPDPLSPCGSAHEQKGSKTDRNRSLNMWTG